MQNKISYRLECAQFVVWVETNYRSIITDCAPIIQIFKGQPLKNLVTWTTRKRWKPKLSRVQTATGN